MKDLILVTGASGGIGAATVKLLAQQGYCVVVHYHQHPERAQQLIDSLPGHDLIAIRADLSLESDIDSLFQHIDGYGRLTGLVNNAGIIGRIGPFQNINAERVNRILAINVTATLLCAREAVKRMSSFSGGKGGVIVNVSSAASRLGSPNEYIDYAASKGAVDTFTVGLAKEVGEQGIRVNAVRPGLIETEMHSLAGMPDRVESHKKTIPLGRGGTAQEVAQTIAWLLSDSASYVTGALIDVNGGR